MAYVPSPSPATIDLDLDARSLALLRFAKWFRFLKPLSEAAVSAALADQPCRLSMPEMAIVRNQAPDGDLILQCLHPSPHCWDLAGHHRSCS